MSVSIFDPLVKDDFINIYTGGHILITRIEVIPSNDK